MNKPSLLFLLCLYLVCGCGGNDHEPPKDSIRIYYGSESLPTQIGELKVKYEYIYGEERPARIGEYNIYYQGDRPVAISKD
jgi:hypothetical protein